MRTIILSIILIILATGCNKKELANPVQEKVISLTITGSSSEQLEFIYKDSVIATTTNPAQISIQTLLAVEEKAAKIDIRKKGATEILQSKLITPVPYAQNVSIYYDGTKVYNSAVTLDIKGYAMSGELEFVMGGEVLLTVTGTVRNTITLLMDKGTSREVEVRLKGESSPLLTRTFESSPEKQSLNFFFDGKKLVDNVQLDPPADPANMMVRAKFESILPQFTQVDVDVVFYIKNITTKVAIKTNPELKFTLSKDGSFNSIELPPLPTNGIYFYSFDIVEKGTNKVPYTSTSAPFILAAFPYQENQGESGELAFEGGKSKLFLLNDKKFHVSTPKRHTNLSGVFIDLSQYFQ